MQFSETSRAAMAAHRRGRHLAGWAVIGSALLLLSAWAPAIAHEGHDHGEKPAAGGEALASPRVAAVSEAYQFVGIVEGEVLVVYLDRAADNAPVTAATIEVSLNGESFKAEPQKKGTYEVTAPLLRKPGKVEVLVTIAEAGTSDLIVGGLTIPDAADAKAVSAAGSWLARAGALFTGLGGDAKAAEGNRTRVIVGGLALLFLGLVGGLTLGRRSRGTAAALCTAALVSLAQSPPGHAGPGHDHGHDMSASTGNTPARRPDGTLFLPKPSQRLLEVRTKILVREKATRTVRLTGRIVANPNFSGVVQGTISGRYLAPPGGVPALGTRVKAGDPLGTVAPSFTSVDASDMAQTLGDLEQKISLAKAKLARQEQLLRTNVVARAAVDETRLEMDGLLKRKAQLLEARIKPEELFAPVAGVIAATRVVSGQVVAPSDRIFEIIDPDQLLVEALVFDESSADLIGEAIAVAAGDATVKLRFMGRSRALQQHYSLMQFQVMEINATLNIGTPVSVIVKVGAPVDGIFIPKAALAQAPNGQMVVFEHMEPEVFVPRQVVTQPFDAQTMIVTGGLDAGAKIVVRNAPLVNQVR
jgi:membrane fusion protein, heavy metal efflux system